MEEANNVMETSKVSEVDNKNFPSTAERINQRPIKICRYYSNYEFCHFGSNCKFLHRRNNAPREFVSKQFTSSRMERNQTKKISPISDHKKNFSMERDQNLSNPQNSNHYKQSCRYFKAGYCDKGEACLYTHTFDSSSRTVIQSHTFLKTTKDASMTSNISIPVCEYFKQGFCNKGDRCKLYHPQTYTAKERVNRFSSSGQNKYLSHCKEIGHNKIKNSSRSGNVDNGDDYLKSSVTVDKAQTNSCDTYSECIYQNVSKHKYINLIPDQSQLIYDDSTDAETNKKSISDQKQIPENKYFEDLPQNRDTCLNNISLTATNNISKDIKMPLSANKVFSLAATPETEIPQLRFTEIAQFMKRFPSYEIIKENQSYAFIFQPSDPDWPFDLKVIKLEVTFPEMYPREICNISVIRTADYMPEMVFRHLNQSISDWLNSRHKAFVESKQLELIFRPFLKWFDRNVEDLFNCGLKKEKQNKEIVENDLQLITTEHLDLTSGDIPLEENNLNYTKFSEEEMHITKEISQVSISPQKNTLSSAICTSQKQGVKVLFIGLEFVEGVAALTCTKVAAMLQCIRCKTSHNVKSPPNKNNIVTCSKCSKHMESNFNPSLLHQFSNVFGTMHLVECQVVDINLVESVFLIDCLNCSKQVGVNGIHYGQKQKLWCMFCNQKLVISIGSVKFQASVPTFATTKTVDKALKKTEKKKDPLIKEGSPLPQFGACKHYKKSNRWLRFPCCGRVYPCDVCHEEKEMDHEMKFASRMICGYCSKEQPYSKEKPCISCASGMVAKSGTHWEGGKGCRNKVKMARDDKHKYAGTSKTVSKKAQSSGNKKK